MLPRVSVITINWNTPHHTRACVRSLLDDDYAEKEIIVVDNGSQDGSVSSLRQEFPSVRVLEAGRNLGFTGGNNLGLRDAMSRCVNYIYFLNNDTISESGTITELVKAAERDSHYGLLTPVIHYADPPREAWFAGSKIDLERGTAVHDNSDVPPRNASPFEIPWACGCAMFGRAELISQLGGFDERYFLIWEDVDLSLRVRRAGHHIALVPPARIYHKVGRSFASGNAVGAAAYYHARNSLMCVRTHAISYRRAACRLIASYARDCVVATCKSRTRGLRLSRSVAAAVLDHMCEHYGMRDGAS